MALSMAALAVGVGAHALIDPDEGRNAAIARAMAGGGDWLVPRLDGLPYLDKPFLYPAATAVSIRLLGPSEWAARLPSLLFSWATVALVAWFGARLFGGRAAWIAGTACATAPLTVAYSRIVIFDPMLGFLVVLALVAFHQAVESPESCAQRFGSRSWSVLAWLAMALGVLTKGPVAIVVPLLVGAPYAIWRRRSRAVWYPAGPLLLLAVIVPWALAVEAREPGFLRYALITETWQRLTTDHLQRNGPLWYFAPYLLAGAFPWILGPIADLPARLRRPPSAGGPAPAVVFLLLWIGLPLILFSLSHSKRPHYVLPLVPAIALLAALAWSRPRPPAAATRAGGAGWLLLGGVLLAVAATPAALDARAGAAIGAAAVPFARTLGVVALGSGLAALRFARHRTLAPIALSLPLIVLPAAAGPLFTRVANERSAKAAAEALRPHLTPDATVVAVETFPASLAFYLGRPVAISTDNPARLGSNYILPSYRARIAAGSPLLRPGGWWWSAVAACERPLFVVLEHPFEPLLAAARHAGLPLLHADGELAALGPCRPPRDGPARSPADSGRAAVTTLHAPAAQADG
jgi:4-amino-4-deoxy-L-arabinose transferase-like glycosyltransferase